MLCLLCSMQYIAVQCSAQCSVFISYHAIYVKATVPWNIVFLQNGHIGCIYLWNHSSLQTDFLNVTVSPLCGGANFFWICARSWDVFTQTKKVVVLTILTYFLHVSTPFMWFILFFFFCVFGVFSELIFGLCKKVNL